MATKKPVALKPKLVTPDEMQALKKKFWSLRTTVTTYQTKGKANVCTLYTFWQWNEKAGQFHDYGYGSVLKSFINNTYYTTEEEWTKS